MQCRVSPRVTSGNPLWASQRLARAQALGIRVDPEDEWLLSEFTWRLVGGYVATTLRRGGRNYMLYLHHCIVGMAWWHGEAVRHRNRDKLDNTRRNLVYSYGGGDAMRRRTTYATTPRELVDA